jgi:predicted permease
MHQREKSMTRLLFSLCLILAGLILGWFWQQRLCRQGRADSLPALRKKLQKIGLLFAMPISFAAAVWVVSFDDPRLILLPFLGAFILLLGGGLAWLFALASGQDARRRGSLFCCGSFTNLGSIGALISFVFLGEAGFALIAIYKIFEEVSYYTVGFPIARSCSVQQESGGGGGRIAGLWRDPFIAAALLALLSGMALNLSGLPRPGVFETINAFLVPAGTFVLLLSIGLGMRLGGIRANLREALVIAGIKFLLLPLVAVSLAWWLGFGEMDHGLPLQVVLIAASMPVAFTALVATSIYDLDLDLANACWLVTTGLLLVVVPWLAFVLSRL